MFSGYHTCCLSCRNRTCLSAIVTTNVSVAANNRTDCALLCIQNSYCTTLQYSIQGGTVQCILWGKPSLYSHVVINVNWNTKDGVKQRKEKGQCWNWATI